MFLMIIFLADIDECALNISGCNQKCTNTIGSYFCSCYPGYQLYKDNETCIGNHSISLFNKYSCLHFLIILLDIDECAHNISGCNQKCNNTIGSYFCSCYLGYQLDKDNETCIGNHSISLFNKYSCLHFLIILLDIDECALNISGCNQKCTNTIGSYFCSCYPGYQLYKDNETCIGNHSISLFNKYSCLHFLIILLDIDECAHNISGCNQKCNNTIGSYFCSCYLGYQLDKDNETCIGNRLISLFNKYTILCNFPCRH